MRSAGSLERVPPELSAMFPQPVYLNMGAPNARR